MATLGNAILKSFDVCGKEEVATYLIENFATDVTICQMVKSLTVFENTILSIPDGVDNRFQAVVKRESDNSEEETLFWCIHVLKVETEEMYASDFVPFDAILRYPVVNFKNEVDVVAEIIWDLTFDGWTSSDQKERIDEFENTLRKK